MRRVLIIGPGGAGKSELARRLGHRWALPVVHLDQVYWKPGWRPPSPAEWEARVASLIVGDAWILDGNFGEGMEARVRACDTIILLDMPPWLCLWRVVVRRLRYSGSTRPDMAPGCPEHLDRSSLSWILTYRRRKLPRVLERLAWARRHGRTVVVLRSARDVSDFLADSRQHAPAMPRSRERPPPPEADIGR